MYMNIKEVAEILNNREYCSELEGIDLKLLKDIKFDYGV